MQNDVYLNQAVQLKNIAENSSEESLRAMFLNTPKKPRLDFMLQYNSHYSKEMPYVLIEKPDPKDNFVYAPMIQSYTVYIEKKAVAEDSGGGCIAQQPLFNVSWSNIAPDAQGNFSNHMTLMQSDNQVVSLVLNCQDYGEYSDQIRGVLNYLKEKTGEYWLYSDLVDLKTFIERHPSSIIQSNPSDYLFRISVITPTGNIQTHTPVGPTSNYQDYLALKQSNIPFFVTRIDSVRNLDSPF